MSRTAVILFNLGGPDSPSAVRPFLFNLFNDRAILRLPAIVRSPLAWLISTKRAKQAQAIYAHMGGKSPIVEQTEAQATALEKLLKADGMDVKVFSSMRYWHPRAADVAAQVKTFAPERIVLLPLYPQYSTTTTASSLAEWKEQAAKCALNMPSSAICCYPTDSHFIAAHVKLLKTAYWNASADAPPRVLFSAHGLPEKIAHAGDPYQGQVEKTVAAIVNVLAIEDLDYSICYQSRVGPLKWIGPSTEEEIRRAGTEGKPVVVVPVSFVSEHSETLVELDIEYAHLARDAGVPRYERVPALGIEPSFIEGLVMLTKSALLRAGVACHLGTRCCPPEASACPCKEVMAETPAERATRMELEMQAA